MIRIKRKGHLLIRIIIYRRSQAGYAWYYDCTDIYRDDDDDDRCPLYVAFSKRIST